MLTEETQSNGREVQGGIALRTFIENDYVVKGEFTKRSDIAHKFIVQPGLQPTVAILPVVREQYYPIPLLKIFHRNKKHSS